MKQVVLLGIVMLLWVACTPDLIKVACIGDSITNGHGLGTESFYPTQLNKMLGEQYVVLNCGESGATMQSKSYKPYWEEKDLSNVFAFKPDVVTIMLGTNDSKIGVWNAEMYERDYQRMIDTLRILETNPEIYLCTPPPAYSHAYKISDSTIQAGVIPIIHRLAERNGLKVIDVYAGMQNMSDLFPDGIHPNNQGKEIMARIIFQELNEK